MGRKPIQAERQHASSRKGCERAGSEEVEGRGVYFHEECFPWDDPAYREKLRPEFAHEVA
jgi:hypothetical protein